MNEEKDSVCNIKSMYLERGISEEVYAFGEQILAGLAARFRAIDENAEYNQLKVLKALQDNQLSDFFD